MNLPNKLTTLRVIMIPFFVFFLLWQNGENHTFRMIALALFIIASLTDLLDGKIARKYNLVTNFGKFMDPLADKLLVCSALICLIELERASSLDGYHHHQPGVYHQRIPSDRLGQRSCHRRQLLGQI